MTLLSVSGSTERGFNRRPARLEIYGFRTFLFSQPLLPRTGLLARNSGLAVIRQRLRDWTLQVSVKQCVTLGDQFPPGLAR